MKEEITNFKLQNIHLLDKFNGRYKMHNEAVAARKQLKDMEKSLK